MSGTPEQIAARLSAAQKRALTDKSGYARGGASTIAALYERNLSSYGVYVGRLTDLGKAVRAVLEAQKP